MKYSTKLSDTLHVLAFIALFHDGVSSAQIAESVRTHPSFVRQIISRLRKAGIVNTSRGKKSTCLARPAGSITMYEVYAAVEGDKPLLHLDIHTNPECGVGVNIQYAIGEFYECVQQAAYQEMTRITLANILERYRERVQACEGQISQEDKGSASG